MNRLQRLPEITDHVLSGLKADDRAKHRILLAASGSQAPGGMHQKTVRFRTVVTLCSLSVLLVLMCVLISYQSRAQQRYTVLGKPEERPVKLIERLEKQNRRRRR